MSFKYKCNNKDII